MPWDQDPPHAMRPEGPREISGPKVSRGIEPGLVSRPFGPQDLRSFLTQGIGLQPQPWARLSRPVGPVLSAPFRRARDSYLRIETPLDYPGGLA